MSHVHRLYAVYDRNVAVHIPFLARDDQAAIQAFTAQIADPTSRYSWWPDDFCLYELGEFDGETGTISPRASKFFVASGQTIAFELKNKRA